jgi:PAS domain S-box-containing protein
MTSWRNIVEAFGATAEACGLVHAAEPAWVFARDGSRVLWANPAGGALLGARRFAALAEHRWAVGHPLRREIANLARSVPEKGSLARLRIADTVFAVPLACRCQRIRAGETRGLLVIGLEAAGQGSAPASDDFFAVDAEAAIEAAPVEPVAAPEPEAPDAVPPQPEVPIAVEVVAPVEEPARPQLRVITPEPIPPTAPLASPAPAAATEPAAEPAQRNVKAGRVERELSRTPVRFLWQTDAADRFLFVSAGLTQVVGRNAEIVGERWQDAAGRLGFDPTGRIARLLAQRDTWSGQTVWWPVEGSEVRVPAELTALPVFGADHSFQGYRGFGVLKPAEALMPAAFAARFGAPDRLAEQVPPYEEAATTVPANVVPIRADLELGPTETRLTAQERNAFEEIAAALKSRIHPEPQTPVAEAEPKPELPPVAETAEAQPVAPEAPEPAVAEPPALEPVVAVEPPPPPGEAAAPPPEPMPQPVAQPAAAPASQAPAEPPKAAARRLSEGEAQRRLREMTAILDTATDGVLMLDAEGRIESANASAEALFGLDAQELQALHFSELLTPDSRQSAVDYLSGLRDSGVASLLNEGREVEALAGSGSIPLFMTMGRISSEEDGRFCAVLRDITQWKRSEADLVAAKRAAETASSQKSEFLARVSHEIRTPLNAIIGFAEVMIEERFGPVENERYREYLRDIRTSGEHVVSLVNDLLDISKIEAGKLDLSFAAVPLNELVRETLGLMQPQAHRAQVVLRSSLSREVPAIVADERTLRQIVLNLLSNSVKYTGPGGQVIASTSLLDSGEAILRVRDTGPGMSEDELARALEPFRQLSTAALADRTGTGLGLPLTKALVEANRANLSIRSARGEGTVVTVTFPPTRVLSE